MTLKIEGMHCSSCAMNIDFALEDLPGVIESKTNYASMKTELYYDPKKVGFKEIQSEIRKLDYAASQI